MGSRSNPEPTQHKRNKDCGYLPQATELLSKPQDEPRPQSVISGPLDINVQGPPPLNELQQRLFTDFVFQWRFYIDDHSIWEYPSPLFNTLAIAILRLASWDFEVLRDGNEVGLPVNSQSVPCWKRPKTETFWFHGFWSSYVRAFIGLVSYRGSSKREVFSEEMSIVARPFALNPHFTTSCRVR